MDRAALGARHGVISLYAERGATFRFADQPGLYVSGGDYAQRPGAGALELEEAARVVLAQLNRRSRP